MQNILNIDINHVSFHFKKIIDIYLLVNKSISNSLSSACEALQVKYNRHSCLVRISYTNIIPKQHVDRYNVIQVNKAKQ